MKNMLKRFGALAVASAIAIMPAAECLASSLTTNPSYLIDTTRRGSLTIHKYDMTDALEDGVLKTVDDGAGGTILQPADTSKGTFSIDGKKDSTAEDVLADYVIPDVEFTYAKVCDIEMVTEGGDVKMVYNINKDLQKALGLDQNATQDKKYTSDDINKALATGLREGYAWMDDSSPIGYKNGLEDYINTYAKPNSKITDANGVINVTNMDLGLYLVIETKVPANVKTTVDPFFVSIPMTTHEGEEWFYDVTVYPKNQTAIPDLDKKVRQNDNAVGTGAQPADATYYDTCTASTGDQVDYIVVSHVPEVTSKATYFTHYNFEDTMDGGITYCDSNDVEILFYENSEAAHKNDKTTHYVGNLVNGTDFTVSIKKNKTTPVYSTMSITMTDKGLAKLNDKNAAGEGKSFYGKYMVVSYYGTVNHAVDEEHAVLGDTGNKNDVVLTWKRTYTENLDKLTDRCKVYTYGIDLTKTFGSTTATVNGIAVKPDYSQVQFILFNQTDNYYVKAINANAGTANGEYTIQGESKTADESQATRFTPNTNSGLLRINGLEADTYVLREVQTADGFSLLKNGIVIEIVATECDIDPTFTTLYDSKDITPWAEREITDVTTAGAYCTIDGTNGSMAAYALEGLGKESTDARVLIEVLNSASFKLPVTGGMGTLMFTMAGCGVAVIAILVATKKKKAA